MRACGLVCAYANETEASGKEFRQQKRNDLSKNGIFFFTFHFVAM